MDRTLFHKQKKMLSFARISSFIKRLEISKTNVKAFGNRSTFQPKTGSGHLPTTQLYANEAVDRERLWQEKWRFQKMLILKNSHQGHNKETTVETKLKSKWRGKPWVQRVWKLNSKIREHEWHWCEFWWWRCYLNRRHRFKCCCIAR